MIENSKWKIAFFSLLFSIFILFSYISFFEFFYFGWHYKNNSILLSDHNQLLNEEINFLVELLPHPSSNIHKNEFDSLLTRYHRSRGETMIHIKAPAIIDKYRQVERITFEFDEDNLLKKVWVRPYVDNDFVGRMQERDIGLWSMLFLDGKAREDFWRSGTRLFKGLMYYGILLLVSISLLVLFELKNKKYLYLQLSKYLAIFILISGFVDLYFSFHHNQVRISEMALTIHDTNISLVSLLSLLHYEFTYPAFLFHIVGISIITLVIVMFRNFLHVKKAGIK